MEASDPPPLAGILPRIGATLLDGIMPSLMFIPASLLGFIAYASFPAVPGDSMQIAMIFVLLLTYVGLFSYSALVLAMWAYGRTPGKWMLGIQVVNRDEGTPAGFWRMALRQIVGQMVSSLCFLGYIWALVDANKQCWHDKIAKTLVIRTR